MAPPRHPRPPLPRRSEGVAAQLLARADALSISTQRDLAAVDAVNVAFERMRVSGDLTEVNQDAFKTFPRFNDTGAKDQLFGAKQQDVTSRVGLAVPPLRREYPLNAGRCNEAGRRRILERNFLAYQLVRRGRMDSLVERGF